MVHRALARQAPENTRPAITMCIADELEWVEIDVRLSKDGIHVLAHDDQLDGKTNGRGRVSDSTAAGMTRKETAGIAWFSIAGSRLKPVLRRLPLGGKGLWPRTLVRDK
ncbi:MAG TPA: glycerophosphodiester phosphodiesterase family protein [Candidatus Acidoferrum sp.]|nr:glycerophosphodiester phosphodiesterase family protein [Candidatus Acidoferrum sp.]